MGATYKNCQSCGMPMSRDEKGGGTNADGSKSTIYCSHCWAAGEFTMPDLTVDQMQNLRAGEAARSSAMPGPLGWFFTRRVPKLERWAGSAGR